jgi:hypothetical protein
VPIQAINQASYSLQGSHEWVQKPEIQETSKSQRYKISGGGLIFPVTRIITYRVLWGIPCGMGHAGHLQASWQGYWGGVTHCVHLVWTNQLTFLIFLAERGVVGGLLGVVTSSWHCRNGPGHRGRSYGVPLWAQKARASCMWRFLGENSVFSKKLKI